MMGTIWIPGSGGGVDLDVVNTKPEDLIAGKVIVDKDGNPLVGTMPVRGGATTYLNAGGSFDILNGYHNGQGRVIANSLASQTPGNTSPEHVRNGRTFWNNGVKGVGTMPEMAGVTINPTNGQQTVATGNKFVTSNVIVSPVSNLAPGNVKKGVQVGNVVGTWEGWVPTPTDYYLRGNNIMGISIYDGQKVTFEAGGIRTVNTSASYQAYDKPEFKFPVVNLTPYNYFNVTLRYESKLWHYNAERNLRMEVRIREAPSYESAYWALGASSGLPTNVEYTISVPISTLAYQKAILVDIGITGEYYYTGDDGNQWDAIGPNTWTGWIYRMWFS